MHARRSLALVTFCVSALLSAAPAIAAKPNILVIWGDDIGGFNIRAYNQGWVQSGNQLLKKEIHLKVEIVKRINSNEQAHEWI